MKHKIKKRKISLKWKVFFYLLLFTGILLLILWLFQICYLDQFYKSIKTKEAEKATDQLLTILKTGTDTDEKIDDLAASYNLAILVTDMDGEELYSAEYLGSGTMKNLPAKEFERFVDKAQENDGFAKIEYVGSQNKTFNEPTNPAAKPVPKPGSTGSGSTSSGNADDGINTDSSKKMFVQNQGSDAAESVIYVRLITCNGQEMVVMLNSQITPVTSTVEALKAQLRYISVIMICLSVLIAFLISYKMSRSIIKINHSAKELAKGNFDVEFDGKDYKEVAELSKTLNYATSELGKTESFRRELIANVSHDLRTPLTMIIAYSEVMRDLPGENTPENIQTVIDESTRLSNLVNDMLDISKLQAGVLQLDTTEYNLTESIMKVMDRYNKLKEQDGYSLSFHYDQEVWIQADESKIFQVIYNLINNAINYTGADKEVHVVQSILDNNVKIEIKDSGEGIPENELDNVWERYYKVDKTHKRAVAGTGLGLSIVKNILELHHAQYGVSSVVGKGTTFWFMLPVLSRK